MILKYKKDVRIAEKALDNLGIDKGTIIPVHWNAEDGKNKVVTDAAQILLIFPRTKEAQDFFKAYYNHGTYNINKLKPRSRHDTTDPGSYDPWVLENIAQLMTVFTDLDADCPTKIFAMHDHPLVVYMYHIIIALAPRRTD